MEKTNDKTSYTEIGQKGMIKTVENVSERAVDSVLNFIRDKYGKACVSTGKSFALYLKNSEKRYNKVKTLADLSEPRPLEGTKGIYVDVFIQYKKKKIAVKTIADLMSISNNIVITGSGGTGKSMLMRHLFVHTLRIGNYIPVLVELRKITNIEEEHALLNLIHACIESFDVKLNQEQFEYSLKVGKYLFLFDGLDEVKEELRGKTEQFIQELSTKYPHNCYIISSRVEGVSFNELETYTLVKACPFEKYQAIELVKKIGNNDEKVIEFADLLDKELYEEHEDFASNPLLLTMMYITFIDNNMIPEHLTDFYDSAYDALYKRHDANKEGLFERDYKCKKLGEREFKDLFAYFCFHSFFVQEYEFTKEEICQYIKNGIHKLNFDELVNDPNMFFDDIKDIVCLIVEEGINYKFAHRSFQTYFAAYYTTVHITDEQQKIFFKGELSNRYSVREDFLYMLYKLEGERFNNNILEPGIKFVLQKIEDKRDPQFELLKIYCQMIAIHEKIVGRAINSPKHMDIPYERNVILLFEELYCNDYSYNISIGRKIIEFFKSQEIYGDTDDIEIEDLLIIEPVSVRNEILKIVYDYYGIDCLLEKLKDWMAKQENRRIKIEENKGRMELLSLL